MSTSKSSDRTLETVGHLALTPNQGGPGTSFEATATGFGLCGSMSFQWDGVELKSVDVDTDGPVVATLQVPAGADARTHDVVVSCGHEHAQSTFAVVVPETRPTLTLVPEKGDPETHITAVITDFRACGDSNNLREVPVPAIVAAVGRHTADTLQPQHRKWR